MSMFNDICDKKDIKDECLANAGIVKVFARKFGVGQWSFIGLGSEKKWYSGEENSPQGAWDHIADEMLMEFAESGHPIFRATTPVSVKSIPPTTENSLRKRYKYSMKNDKSTEDKHETNHINNKCTNTYTRKLHNL